MVHDDVGEHQQENLSVALVFEDSLAAVPSGRDVVEAVRDLST